MCQYIYIGLSKKTQIIDWNPEKPSISIEEIDKKNAFTNIFKSNYIYYIGSSSGCGCGFTSGSDDLEKLKYILYNLSLENENVELLIWDILHINYKKNKRLIQDLYKERNYLLDIELKAPNDNWWNNLTRYNIIKKSK